MHWYVLSKTNGTISLCASSTHARCIADLYDRVYPQSAPHIATQIVPIDPQELIDACVPGGAVCDPQVVEDAIRLYFTDVPE